MLDCAQRASPAFPSTHTRTQESYMPFRALRFPPPLTLTMLAIHVYRIPLLTRKATSTYIDSGAVSRRSMTLCRPVSLPSLHMLNPELHPRNIRREILFKRSTSRECGSCSSYEISRRVNAKYACLADRGRGSTAQISDGGDGCLPYFSAEQD